MIWFLCMQTKLQTFQRLQSWARSTIAGNYWTPNVACRSVSMGAQLPRWWLHVYNQLRCAWWFRFLFQENIFSGKGCSKLQNNQYSWSSILASILLSHWKAILCSKKWSAVVKCALMKKFSSSAKYKSNHNFCFSYWCSNFCKSITTFCANKKMQFSATKFLLNIFVWKQIELHCFLNLGVIRWRCN